MKQILGKIFLILYLTLLASADVKVSVSSPVVYEGDNINFIISADGDKIIFPSINEIGGNAIIGTSSAESINIINSKMTRTTSKTYSFRSNKPVTIPSFTVDVDGKEYKTKELKVDVVKPTASKNGSEFVLEMSLDKNESYVGEAVDLSITFKRRANSSAEKLQLGEPKLESFWVKKVEGVDHGSKGEYIFQTEHYQLFPQKSGEFNIPAIEALVGKATQRQRGGFFNDPFFGRQLNWQKVYSNDLKLSVKALPNGLELYGKYQIKAKADKLKVQANKPVNLTIEVIGEGNIDDVKKFDPVIDNVIIYADEPKITSNLKGGVYQGRFSQKVALIADQNFTIPALRIEYFDKETKEVKSVETKPIEIEVVGGTKAGATSIEVSPSQNIKAPTTAQTITKTKVLVKTEDWYIKYIFLAIGFALGVGLSYGIYRLKNRVEYKESDMVKAIRKAKGDRALFDILLPYAKENRVIGEALNKLEENLYRGGKNSVDKESLMEVFEG